MKQYIYKIVNKINGKLYIGSSLDWKERKKSHTRELRKNQSSSKKLQAAWNKYGEENFEFILMEIVPNHLNMVWREEELVIEYNTTKKGYNIKLPYTEQKLGNASYSISKSIKEWIDTNAPYNLKSITKEEWIQKRKENPNFTIYKRRTDGKSIYSEIIGVDCDGNITSHYNSITEAYKELKVNKNTLGDVLKSNKEYTKFLRTKGLIWYYKESFDINKFLNLKKELSKPKIKNKKTYERNYKKSPDQIIPYSERNIARSPISIRNISTGEIKDFVSKVECSDFLNTPVSNIHCLVKGIKNKGRGRVSKFTSIKGWELDKRFVFVP